MSVICAYCVSNGYFKYEDKVSKYWPEFAQGDKQDVTIKEILQHRGGVGWLDEENRPTYKECEDLDVLKVKLERQKHNFGGKKTQSYHAASVGSRAELENRPLLTLSLPHLLLARLAR